MSHPTDDAPASVPLTLSYSSTTSLRQCPQRWHLEHTDTIPKAPSLSLVFGSAWHATLECDGYCRIVHDAMSVAELTETFVACLDQALHDDDPFHLLAGEREALIARGQRHIATYVARMQPAYHPLTVEEVFTLPVPGEPDLQMTGIIDAITEPLVAGTPCRTIVDMKTTTPKSLQKWKQSEVDRHEQATMYLLAEQIRHAKPARRVTFVLFVDREDVVTLETRTTTRTRDQHNAYGEHLAQLAGQVRSWQAQGAFPTRPSPLCGWCQVLGSCPVGQRFLRNTGRTPVIPVVGS